MNICASKEKEKNRASAFKHTHKQNIFVLF